MPLPPIIYINLDKDAERRTRLQKQLAALGLQAERMPGVWWKALNEEQRARYYSAQLNSAQYYRPLVDGEKGCYGSHLKACMHLLDSDAEQLVVFEDDIRILPELPKALEAIAALPPGWDMIKLFGREDEKIREQQPLAEGLALIRYQRVPSFATGYVLSRAGAQKMLATRMPFGRPVDVDWRFWFETNLQIYGVHPSVIALDDTSEVSSIWDQRDHLTLAQRLGKFKVKMQLSLGNARGLLEQRPQERNWLRQLPARQPASPDSSKR